MKRTLFRKFGSRRLGCAMRSEPESVREEEPKSRTT